MLIQNQILFMQLGYCWVDNDGIRTIVRKWQVVKRKGTSYSYWTSAPCGWLLKCCHEHLELLVTLLCPYLFLNTNKIMSSPHFYTHQQLMYFKWEFLLWIWEEFPFAALHWSLSLAGAPLLQALQNETVGKYWNQSGFLFVWRLKPVKNRYLSVFQGHIALCA